VLLSMVAAAQRLAPTLPPADTVTRTMAPTMVQLVPYPDEPDEIEAALASCYRVRRCSAYDLYQFPVSTQLATRRAPVAPMELGTADSRRSTRGFSFQ
jgi:hypothetical protein